MSPPALRAEDLDAITDLAHDLGKYIRFDARWEPEGAPLAARWLARRRDLHETRRAAAAEGGEALVEGAEAIWGRLCPPPASPLWAAPCAQAVAAAMHALTEQAPALLGPPPAEAEAEAILAAIDRHAEGVQRGLRAWRSWARAACPDAPEGGPHGEAARH